MSSSASLLPNSQRAFKNPTFKSTRDLFSSYLPILSHWSHDDQKSFFYLYSLFNAKTGYRQFQMPKYSIISTYSGLPTICTVHTRWLPVLPGILLIWLCNRKKYGSYLKRYSLSKMSKFQLHLIVRKKVLTVTNVL